VGVIGVVGAAGEGLEGAGGFVVLLLLADAPLLLDSAVEAGVEASRFNIDTGLEGPRGTLGVVGVAGAEEVLAFEAPDSSRCCR
jgi:hypothetical protein